MNIILAITGSISAYKMIDLAKELNKKNSVKVIVSHSAKEFLNPKVFNYFNIPFYENDFDSSGVLHIELARWADTFLLCPASAHKISVLAKGQCDDLISSTFLSLKPEVKKIIVPAMNVEMYKNKITQKNMKELSSLVDNTYFINPDSGLLACGEEGEGKLPNVKTLTELVPLFDKKPNSKTVVITAGATVVPIDSVRFISNPGKGGTGFLLAKAFLKEGYTVHVIKGVNSTEQFEYLKKHPQYTEEVVVTTDDLLDVVKKLKDYYAYISPMAVSDLKMVNPSKVKLKKKDLDKLQVTSAPDVLKHVIENRKVGQIVIGFAAESSLSDEVIAEKINRKPVDLLVVNVVDSGFLSKKAQGFGTKEGSYKFVTKENTIEFPAMNKEEVAERILSFVLDFKSN
jgi:phosphopantothenoylcysteine decarboxylase/phosphopantothenate--cysteine ligase